MEIDVTKIPSLGEGYVVTDANGNVSVEGLGVNQSQVLYLNENGYAGTPEVGNPRKPYQTHAAALAAASFNTTIVVIGNHFTTTNLAKDGLPIVYFAPTPNDGINFTDDFASMIFTGSDSAGTGVGLYGDGYFDSTGLDGNPCIYCGGGAITTNLIVECGRFTSNATNLLLGGTNGNIEFRPKRFAHTSSGQVFNGSPESNGKIRIGGFDLRLDGVLTSNSPILGVNIGGPDSLLYIEDIVINSTVTQTNPSYLLSPTFSSPIGDGNVGNIKCNVPNVKIFNNLVTGEANPYKITLTGNVSTLGTMGITTALDSELGFTGTGILKASDRTIDVTYGVDRFVNNTVDFDTVVNSNKKTYEVNAIVALVSTIITDTCAIGESFSYVQLDTAGVSWLAGTNVTLINNTGILALTAEGDYARWLRLKDAAGNQVYTLTA